MVAKPFSALDGIIAKHQRRLNSALTVAVKRAGLAAQQTAVLATRVDKGPARSNWVIQVGSPFQGVIPAYAPGMRLGKGERGNARGAINQGRSAVKGFTLSARSLFLTNNVEYITELDRGRPSLPPDNMMAKAVQVGTLTLSTEFKKAARSRGRRR